MLVKCKGCNKKIERDMAYNNRVNTVNNYYCNEKEFLKTNKEKECRKRVFEIVDNVFGYKVINNVLKKDLSEICNSYTYALVYDFIYEKGDKIADILSGKDFASEYSKIKYFCAIIKNKIGDYKNTKPKEYKEDIKVESIKVNFRKVKSKKSLDEYLEGYCE